MANNVIEQAPFSAAGVRPGMWFLTSTENYDTIITPGYLNSVASAGIEFQPNDIVFAQYNEGSVFGMFIVTVTDGVFSLNVYSPNNNSFIFENVIFVAKGGSDLNPGTSIGLPKLTIQDAIDTLNLGPDENGAVWVLDSGEYDENLIVPFNTKLWAPNANLVCSTGDLITINDTGGNTVCDITCNSLTNNGSGLAINLLGSQSNVFLNVKIIQGDMYIEGGLVDCVIAQVVSDIEVASTGVFGPTIINAIAVNLTVNSGGLVIGAIGTVNGPDSNRDIYGKQTFIDRLIYQTLPITETAGRVVVASDSNARIVYNNAAAGNFELPATADEAIPLGTSVEFAQLGLGPVVFVAGAGVTIVSSEGSDVETAAAGSVAKAYKYTDTIWMVSGDITPSGE